MYEIVIESVIPITKLRPVLSNNNGIPTAIAFIKASSFQSIRTSTFLDMIIERDKPSKDPNMKLRAAPFGPYNGTSTK
jgi:hypothetical protein